MNGRQGLQGEKDEQLAVVQGALAFSLVASLTIV
jgi:hypothetical protein